MREPGCCGIDSGGHVFGLAKADTANCVCKFLHALKGQTAFFLPWPLDLGFRLVPNDFPLLLNLPEPVDFFLNLLLERELEPERELDPRSDLAPVRGLRGRSLERPFRFFDGRRSPSRASCKLIGRPQTLVPSN